MFSQKNDKTIDFIDNFSISHKSRFKTFLLWFMLIVLRTSINISLIGK